MRKKITGFYCFILNNWFNDFFLFKNTQELQNKLREKFADNLKETMAFFRDKRYNLLYQLTKSFKAE
ncbi:hypothetical protein BpHYR1_016980 [Brachionus plicatilis]|uniref:Uncharacterized protein n=1 Tax=Brachionus plicatilis TaxID=10195 RepID=A0A3M7Q606_BRAPC|nr:hypothetical protein BpHYR1_016980 [Brachionus plicatilis]